MGNLLDIFGANKARKAQEKAADRSIAASTDATNRSTALNADIFNRIWSGTQVQRDAGDAATQMMARLMGLSLPSGSQAQPGQPQTQPALSTGYGATSGFSGGYSGNDNALMGVGAQDMAAGGGMLPNALSGSKVEPQVLPQQPGVPQVLPGQTGQGATGNAFNATDWVRSTPGYEINFNEGARALNTRLAGQGRLQSGDASREAIRYGQNYGDRIYSDQYNRLAGIAGAGQTAQSQGASAGSNYAAGNQNALQWNANNLSSSYQNKANATSGFWGDMTGKFGSDAIARYAGQFARGGM